MITHKLAPEVELQYTDQPQADIPRLFALMVEKHSDSNFNAVAHAVITLPRPMSNRPIDEIVSLIRDWARRQSKLIPGLPGLNIPSSLPNNIAAMAAALDRSIQSLIAVRDEMLMQPNHAHTFLRLSTEMSSAQFNYVEAKKLFDGHVAVWSLEYTKQKEDVAH